LIITNDTSAIILGQRH